ncbi:MAG: hotdog fold thioesterase [Flavobacteriales bacterium]|nr:hotdog fold thioesterase [Flavobacteriales bacterium]
MKIWHGQPDIALIEKLSRGTIHDVLGIEIIEIGDDYLMGKMPVDHRTVQPYGLLHGGASVVLAESLGSIAATCVVDTSKYAIVGLDVSANHLRPIKTGFVYGKATPVHLGRKVHVWDIDIKSDADKLICKSRLTIAVIRIDELPAG